MFGGAKLSDPFLFKGILVYLIMFVVYIYEAIGAGPLFDKDF